MSIFKIFQISFNVRTFFPLTKTYNHANIVEVLRPWKEPEFVSGSGA